MKVLYITPGCFDKGGVSRFSRYQISALRKIHGSDNVRVISSLGPDEHAFEEPFEVTWHGGKNSLRNRLLVLANFFRHAVFWRPNIVHSAHIHYAYIAHLARKFSGGQAWLNVYGLEVWSTKRKLALKGLNLADKVIADCHNTADYVSEHQLHRNRPTVIWDPVDTQRFCQGDCPSEVLEKYGLPDKRSHFIVLTLGRLTKTAAHKGYDRLIEAFSRIVGDVPSARLVICGRGDNQPFLKELAQEKGIGDRVHFAGAIDEADLADVYRSGSVFSLVSDQGDGRGEGIPLTPLEAAACGTPIIVGDQDGSREAIFDGQNGVCISPHDLTRHAEALTKFALDRSYRQATAEAAVGIAHQEFSFERFVKQHRECYSAH